MKYKLIKEISGIKLKVGDIIDSEMKIYSTFDLSNQEYFAKELKFLVGAEVLYKKTLSKIIRYNERSNTYLIVYDNRKISVIEMDLKYPSFFWFINSNGEIHRDFLERRFINMKGLKFKKITNNYFLSKDDAINRLKLIMNKQ